MHDADGKIYAELMGQYQKVSESAVEKMIEEGIPQHIALVIASKAAYSHGVILFAHSANIGPDRAIALVNKVSKMFHQEVDEMRRECNASTDQEEGQ